MILTRFWSWGLLQVHEAKRSLKLIVRKSAILSVVIMSVLHFTEYKSRHFQFHSPLFVQVILSRAEPIYRHDRYKYNYNATVPNKKSMLDYVLTKIGRLLFIVTLCLSYRKYACAINVHFHITDSPTTIQT